MIKLTKYKNFKPTKPELKNREWCQRNYWKLYNTMLNHGCPAVVDAIETNEFHDIEYHKLLAYGEAVLCDAIQYEREDPRKCIEHWAPIGEHKALITLLKLMKSVKEKTFPFFDKTVYN